MRLTVGRRTYDLTTRALVVAADEVADTAAASVALVRLTRPTPPVLERCARAGATVIVPPRDVGAARAAGFPSDRIVPDTLFVDVTGAHCPVAATAVGVIRGARVVRTTDVRGARRICDVLAAVLEAR